MTNATELIQLAQKAHAEPTLLKFAQFTTEVEAEALRQKLLRRKRLYDKALTPLLAGGFLLIALAIVATTDWAVTNTFKLFIDRAVSLTIVGWGAWALVVWVGWGGSKAVLCDDDDVKLTRPIAGTHLCEQAAEYIAKSPWAAQWRDMVLTQREQLRKYDVEIMYYLASLYISQEAHRERQERYAAACKAVHSLEPAVA